MTGRARRPATRALVLVPILVGVLLTPAVGRTQQAPASPAPAPTPAAQQPATQPPSAQAPTTQPLAAQAPPAQPSAHAVPDFKLSASPERLTVRRGATGKVTVTVEALAGFNGRVDLLSSLLYATTMTFTPTAIEKGAGTAVLTIAPSRTAIPGTYTVSINAAYLAMARSITVMVTVK